MSAPNDVVKRLTEVLAQADWIAQQPDEIACELLPVVQGYAAEQLRNAAAAYCGDGLSGRALNSLFRARAEALEQQGR